MSEVETSERTEGDIFPISASSSFGGSSVFFQVVRVLQGLGIGNWGVLRRVMVDLVGFGKLWVKPVFQMAQN